MNVATYVKSVVISRLFRRIIPWNTCPQYFASDIGFKSRLQLIQLKMAGRLGIGYICGISLSTMVSAWCNPAMKRRSWTLQHSITLSNCNLHSSNFVWWKSEDLIIKIQYRSSDCYSTASSGRSVCINYNKPTIKGAPDNFSLIPQFFFLKSYNVYH